MIKKKFIILLSFLFLCISNIAYSSNFFELKAEKINYENNKKIITATGNSTAYDQLGRVITSDKIVYNKEKNIISTSGKSRFNDGKNQIQADIFIYKINEKIIEAKKNVVFQDIDGNKFYFNNFSFNENNQKGIGNKLKSSLKNQSYIEADKSELNNKTKIRKFKNSFYTTCKNLNIKKGVPCPSWSITSSETIHDTNSKTITHKNSLLKIKKIPIFYTPYISHPDPTVSRQSGFLPPIIKTLSDVGRTINIPYFFVISDDKDALIEPVYYFDQHPMLKTTYRQAFKNGNLKIETAYTKGYKKTNTSKRTSGSRNYIFGEYDKKLRNNFSKNRNIKFKFQRVSQQNFLRVNKLNGDLFKEDIRSLENSVNLTSVHENSFLSLKTGIFENLNIPDSSKYTYYLPDGQFSFNTRKVKNFNINTNTYFQGKKFSGNQREGKINNLIKLDRIKNLHQKTGLETNYKIYLYNKNKYIKGFNNNDSFFKSNNNLTAAFDVGLPLLKSSKNKYQMILPKIFFKHTTGSMQSAQNNSKILNYSDIFSMNRTNDDNAIETGSSVGYGIEYLLSRNNNNVNNFYKLNAGLGQVYRSKSEDKMPQTSSLNNKSSDFAGFIKLNSIGSKNEIIKKYDQNISNLNNFKNNGISISYDFNLDNNFSQFNRNKFSFDSVYKTFKTKLTFDEKNKHIGNARTGEIQIQKLLFDNYYLGFNAKRNLKKDSSEYQNLSINYETDCIKMSLSLAKNFYQDKDLNNSKTLIFGVTFKPFSDSLGPDLTDFIN